MKFCGFLRGTFAQYAPQQRCDCSGMARWDDESMAEQSQTGCGSIADPSACQFLAHPIGLLWSMFVRDVVADVIAVLKHP
jgi:hypothetical protein